LVVAGGNTDYLSGAELYDPATNTWTTIASLATARTNHTATLLGNGKVLVAGGYDGSADLSSAELYDPAASASKPTIVEYYLSSGDTYFITADPAEQAAVDSGAAGVEWGRTGGTFGAGGPNQVCRFYGSLSPGPNSHFYTANAAECADLKQLQASTPASQKRWNFESNDFNTTPAVNGACPAGLVPVYRAYNNGFTRGIDSNHRITTNRTSIEQVAARGWIDEGIVMCARQ
jgi:hypothetical protein